MVIATTHGGRCLRCGCPRPRSWPVDPYGLGLCDYHNAQLAEGTIGEGFNPRLRQHPIGLAAILLDEISSPHESLRQIARRTGLSKDVVHAIRRKKYRHIRSADWEILLDAVADYRFTEALKQQQSQPLLAA